MIHHPRGLDRPHTLRHEEGPIAAGANWTYTPPVRTWDELITLAITFTTDATVANRRMILVFGGITDDDFIVPSIDVQPASTTLIYVYGRAVGVQHATFYDGYSLHPLPNGLLIQNPEQVRTEIVGLQAGDQITAVRARFYQWHDPVFTG